jgi:hypothetical protein
MADVADLHKAASTALDGQFTFEPSGLLDIKGKRMMETYFLVAGV